MTSSVSSALPVSFSRALRKPLEIVSNIPKMLSHDLLGGQGRGAHRELSPASSGGGEYPGGSKRARARELSDSKGLLGVGDRDDGIEVHAPFAVSGVGVGIAVVLVLGRPVFAAHIDDAHKLYALQAEVLQVKGIATGLFGVGGIDVVVLVRLDQRGARAAFKARDITGKGVPFASVLANLDPRGLVKTGEGVFEDDKIRSGAIGNGWIHKTEGQRAATSDGDGVEGTSGGAEHHIGHFVVVERMTGVCGLGGRRELSHAIGERGSVPAGTGIKAVHGFGVTTTTTGARGVVGGAIGERT